MAHRRGPQGSPSAPLQAFVVLPGHEPALQAELPAGRLSGPRWPALLSTREPLPLMDPAFALQQLPDARWVRADSPEALGRAAAAEVAPALAAASAWLLHTLVPDPQAYRTLLPLLAPLAASFTGELGRLAPGLAAPRTEPGGNFGEHPLVQLVLVGRGSLLVSAARPRALAAGGFDLRPWPAGNAPVPEDCQAPSRAYRKLCEGFAWLGKTPAEGELCIDLGGSPGGWAWTALQRGAAVVAVDRAPLEPPARGHPRLSMVVGDAFTYRPTRPADWLLCDVISRPERTLDSGRRLDGGGLVPPPGGHPQAQGPRRRPPDRGDPPPPGRPPLAARAGEAPSPPPQRAGHPRLP